MESTRRIQVSDAQLQQAYANAQGHHIDVFISDDVEESWGEFQELAILEELRAYVRKTYGQHYAKDGVQAFSLISKKPERGLGFAVGNIIKYADRYGSKNGHNRDDLLKVAHYALLALHCDSKRRPS